MGRRGYRLVAEEWTRTPAEELVRRWELWRSWVVWEVGALDFATAVAGYQGA